MQDRNLPSVAKLMLNATYTLGPAGADQLVFTKQGDDAQSSTFTVRGLANNAARNLKVQHQVDSKGVQRSSIRLDEIDVDPAISNTGSRTSTSSLYLVIQRAPFKTAAQMESMRVRLKTIVDDATLFSALLSQEK